MLNLKLKKLTNCILLRVYKLKIDMLRKSLSIITRELDFTTFSKIRARKLCYLTNKYLDTRNKQLIAHHPQVFVQPCREYAKGKNIKKDKKMRIQIDENELQEVFDIEKLYADLNKPLEIYKEDLVQQTSLRSSQGVIENFKVQFDGDNYVVQDLAEITKKPKMYVMDFAAFPAALPIVKTALEKSDLNLNIQQDTGRLYVPIPKVTKEHREILAKKSKALFVKCKDSVRDVQNKYIKKLKNIDKLSEDLKISVTNQLTHLGNQNISIAEDILKQKQEELLKTE